MANIADFSRMADELPEQEYDLVPEGVYNADIEKAELKDTKNGTGQYINLQLKIIGPTSAGRVVFAMINIKNANPKAEEIGLRQLKELRTACGIATLRDTDELIGRTVKIKVKINPEKDGYKASNSVASYQSINGGAMPAPGSNGTTAAPVASVSTPPWARK
ncbi:MAG TPA: DUF669 domain-containing protein [Spirochaetia bacterium]|nr:DUF669 domain-containing protein [Spirochaetia bacterium]